VIFYNVWFSFKPGSDENVEMVKVRAFLEDLKARGKVHGYRLMKNFNPKEKTKLPPYQFIAEFVDGTQFGLPFAEVGKIGVHAGKHGAMIENVDQFMVEVFEDL
jgi:hypothetical protein